METKMGTIATTPNGGIGYWRTNEGRDIVFGVTHLPDGGVRGGLTTHAPTIDSTASGDLLQGHTAWVRDRSTDARGSLSETFSAYLGGIANFLWKFHVLITISYNHDEEALTYQVGFLRLEDCGLKQPMPLSGEVQVYIAANSGNLGFLCEAARSFNTSNTGSLEVPSSYPLGEDEHIILSRDDGRLTLQALQGFDRVELWSDNPRSYLRAGLAFGSDKPIRLRPGELYSTMVHMVYRPTRR